MFHRRRPRSHRLFISRFAAVCTATSIIGIFRSTTIADSSSVSRIPSASDPLQAACTAYPALSSHQGPRIGIVIDHEDCLPSGHPYLRHSSIRRTEQKHQARRTALAARDLAKVSPIGASQGVAQAVRLQCSRHPLTYHAVHWRAGDSRQAYCRLHIRSWRTIVGHFISTIDEPAGRPRQFLVASI
jgi:hypothetical protein